LAAEQSSSRVVRDGTYVAVWTRKAGGGKTKKARRAVTAPAKRLGAEISIMGRRAVATPESFCVQVLTPKEGVLVLAPCGELDLYTAPELRGALLAALDDGFARVIVDLTQVTFFDSSALGVLVVAARRSAAGAAGLEIVCPPGHMARIIEIAGLDRVLTMRADRLEALADN
jgi:anti-sigma B factor antagonist